MSTQCPFFHEEWIATPGHAEGRDAHMEGAQVTIRQWCNREETPWPKVRLSAAKPLACHGDLETCPLH